MKCPKCYFENLDSVKFCQNCGTKLEKEGPSLYVSQLRNKFINAVRSPLFIIAVVLLIIGNLITINEMSGHDYTDSIEVVQEIFDENDINYNLEEITDAMLAIDVLVWDIGDFVELIQNASMVTPVLTMICLIMIIVSSFVPARDYKMATMGFSIIKVMQIISCIASCLLYTGILIGSLDVLSRVNKNYVIPEGVVGLIILVCIVAAIIKIVYTVAICETLNAGISVATGISERDISHALTGWCYLIGAVTVLLSRFGISAILEGVAIILFGVANKKFGESAIVIMRESERTSSGFERPRYVPD